MIGKKMLLWIGAALLSAATIPAIGATVSHRAKKLHGQRVHQVLHHKVSHKTAVKTVGHKTLAHKTAARSTHLKSTHLVKLQHGAHRTHLVHSTHAAHRLHATRAATGIRSMHSGRTTLVEAPASKSAKVVAVKHGAPAKTTRHLLAATSSGKMQ